MKFLSINKWQHLPKGWCTSNMNLPPPPHLNRPLLRIAGIDSDDRRAPPLSYLALPPRPNRRGKKGSLTPPSSISISLCKLISPHLSYLCPLSGNSHLLQWYVPFLPFSTTSLSNSLPHLSISLSRQEQKTLRFWE